MTLAEIRELLEEVAGQHMPRLDPTMMPQRRVSLLEDYLNLTAVLRAQLEQARLCVHTAAYVLEDEWDGIAGWGMHLPASRSKPTQADVTEAKREVRPDLHQGIKDARRLIARLSEQLDRLELDDKCASRLYTMVSGG